MKWTSAIAIYFVIWWTCLFLVLPFGVRNAAETGERVQQGNDAGAPVAPGLWKKALVTTCLASLIYAGVYWVLANNLIETMDIPFIRDMPKI